MSESLDQSIREEMAIKSVEDRQLSRKVNSPSRTRLLIGLSFSLVVLLSGTVLVFSEGFGSLNLEILGFLLLPMGMWITASFVLGGLGLSSWYRLSWGYLSIRQLGRFLPLFLRRYIGSEESEEEDRREVNEKAENIEARDEDDKSRREREKSGFD